MKPKPIIRWIHDTYSTLVSRQFLPLRWVNWDEVAKNTKLVLCPAGTEDLYHPLEEAFYGKDFAKSNVSWPQIACYQFQDVYTAGDQGRIFLSKERALKFSDWNISERPEKVRRPISMLAENISGSVFHLTGRNHENHGHFLTEHFPRYYLARRMMPEIANQRILLAPGHRRWQRRYLDLLGVSESLMIEGTPGTQHFDDLWFVPQLEGHAVPCKPALFSQMVKDMQDALSQIGRAHV